MDLGARRRTRTNGMTRIECDESQVYDCMLNFSEGMYL
jgi:hypothetical protein